MRVIAAKTRKWAESTANGMGRGGSREEEGLAPVPLPGFLPGEFQQNIAGGSKYFGVRPELISCLPLGSSRLLFSAQKDGKIIPCFGRVQGNDTGTGLVCPKLGLGPLCLPHFSRLLQKGASGMHKLPPSSSHLSPGKTRQSQEKLGRLFQQ